MNLHLPKQSPNHMKEDHSALQQADEASETSATDTALGTSEQSLDNVFHGINQTSPASAIDDARPPATPGIEQRPQIVVSQNYHPRALMISSDPQNLAQQVHESAPANVLPLAFFNSPPEREAVTESVPPTMQYSNLELAHGSVINTPSSKVTGYRHSDRLMPSLPLSRSCSGIPRHRGPDFVLRIIEEALDIIQGDNIVDT